LFAVEEIKNAGGVRERQLELDARDGQNHNALILRLLHLLIESGAFI
jgi:hypothetical protein